MEQNDSNVPQTRIRPETAWIEVSPETARLRPLKAAVISAACAAFSVLAIAGLTAVFRAVAAIQVVLYIVGVIASLVAVIAGAAAVVALRKSVLPRGRLAAWCGLIIGLAVLAVGAVGAARLISGVSPGTVYAVDGNYSVDRPAGWLALPSNTFDAASDIEMMALDGESYVLMKRTRAESPIDGLTSFLAEVYLAPYSHGSSQASQPIFFEPNSIRLSGREMERLEQMFRKSYEDLRRSVEWNEGRYERLKSEGKPAEAVAQSLARDKSVLSWMEYVIGQRELSSMLRHFVEDRLYTSYTAALPIGRLDGAEGRWEVEVVLTGESESGKSILCESVLWIEGDTCYRLTGFAQPSRRAELEKVMRGIASSFRRAW